MTGVDLARGLALVGMMAKHVFDDVTEHGPTATGLIASGRAATTFALVAGVSIAFLSGGPRILHGRARTAAATASTTISLAVAQGGVALTFSASNTCSPASPSVTLSTGAGSGSPGVPGSAS